MAEFSKIKSTFIPSGVSDPIYQPSLIKTRKRATQAEMETRHAALFGILGAIQPATVRQVFYQATVHGVVEKSEDGYGRVQRDLVALRRSGVIPYGWITDNTRWMRKPRSFDSVEDAINDTARLYRKSLWRDADAYVEIWLEKDALSGVISDITSEWDVPLMVARGYASLSFLHSSADDIAELEKPAYIYHFGDFDPSGVNAALKIEETLHALAPRAEIHFERVAVRPEQITAWELPTRPTKASDSRSKAFGSQISVELDAIPPNLLRDLVDSTIRRHVDERQLRILKVAEESERSFLKALARDISRH